VSLWSAPTYAQLVRPYVLPATRLVVQLSPAELAGLRRRLGTGSWRTEVAAEYGLSVQQVLDAADLAGELTLGRPVRHLRVLAGGADRLGAD
jgi:hypothetical protein